MLLPVEKKRENKLDSFGFASVRPVLFSVLVAADLESVWVRLMRGSACPPTKEECNKVKRAKLVGHKVPALVVICVLLYMFDAFASQCYD